MPGSFIHRRAIPEPESAASPWQCPCRYARPMTTTSTQVLFRYSVMARSESSVRKAEHLKDGKQTNSTNSHRCRSYAAGVWCSVRCRRQGGFGTCPAYPRNARNVRSVPSPTTRRSPACSDMAHSGIEPTSCKNSNIACGIRVQGASILMKSTQRLEVQ